MSKYLMMAAVGLLAGFASCSSDDDDGGGGVIPGKTGYAELKIIDGIPATYASGETEPPIAGEIELSTEMEIYIFDEDEKFESLKQVTYDDATKKTSSFQVTSGNKYFYVFSNLPQPIPMPNVGDARVDFEKSIKIITIETDSTSISKRGKFFIGTLYGSETTVAGTGTPAVPEPLSISIGRIASKVNLISVPDNASGSAIKGGFSEKFYRIRSIPEKVYLVGQYQGSTPPPALGVQTISAVHEEAPLVGGNPNPVFHDYDFTSTSNINAPMYTIENTSKKDGTGNIYYGNTSYIQLRVKYTPDAGEVYRIDGSTGGVVPGNGTFYTGILNSSRHIFEADPSTNTDVTSIKQYTNGIMYYNFPIKDISEATIELQTSIIRNHYYEVTVKSISNLGENTDLVDPEKPITEEKDVLVEVTVLPWSKITYEIEL